MNRKTVAIFSPIIGGGVKKHVNEYIQYIKRSFNVLDIRYRDNTLFLKYIKNGKEIFSRTLCGYDINFLFKIFRCNMVSVVHIEHFIYAPDILLEFYKKIEIPLVITIHDFYTICPNINIFKNGSICDYLNENECDNCMYGNLTIREWRNRFYPILKKAKYVICPSKNTKSYYFTVYNDLNYKVIPNVEKIRSIPRIIRTKTDSVRVGLLGKIEVKKGADVIINIAQNTGKEGVEFFLFGTIENHRENMPSNLHVLGRYDDNNILDLISKHNIDFFWFPGRVPETYCYALSIPIWGGYPVLAYNIGAIGERIVQNNWGDVYGDELDDIGIKEKLISFKKERKKYEKNLVIQNTSYPSVNEYYGDLSYVDDLNVDQIKKMIDNEDKINYKRYYSIYDIYYYWCRERKIKKIIHLVYHSNYFDLTKQILSKMGNFMRRI